MSDHFAIEPDDLITPEDIESRVFTTNHHGYDPTEVRSYLSRVAVFYRTALQDAQMADLRAEQLHDQRAQDGDVVRHAEIELTEARALRETAAAELAAAEQMRDTALRHREEAQAALEELRAARALRDDDPVDPYEHAALQVAAIMRAADETATGLRRDSDDILQAAKLESDKTIADAEAAKLAMETEALRFTEEQQILASSAAREYEAVVAEMQGLQSRVQDALAGLSRDITPGPGANGMKLAS